MRAKLKRTISLLIPCLLVAAAALSCLGCGGGPDASAISEIKQNARRTLAGMRSYHSRAEIVYRDNAQAPQGRAWTIVTESEVWVKGNDKLKEVTKTSGREEEGIPPTESVTVLNGDTVAFMGPDSVDIVRNNPPFDSYYRDHYLPFDLARELSSLAESGACSLLGTEEVRGRDTLKVTIDRAADEPQGLSGSSPDREILWVDRADSVCWRKESYRGAELVEAADVMACEVNADIPDSVFAVEDGGYERKTESDRGYREVGIEEVEALCGFRPVKPAYLPGGYAASSSGWRDPAASGLPLDLDQRYTPLWFKEYYLSYTDGFAEINICEAKRYDTQLDDRSSLGIEDVSSSVVEAVLSGGRTAYYEPGVETLYFFLDGIKVKIKAGMPLEELLRVAESMRQPSFR